MAHLAAPIDSLQPQQYSDVIDGSFPEWDLELLYRAYQKPVLAHLIRLVSNRAVAEDLCQETFFKALRGWAHHDVRRDARAWLYRIATNTAYDYLRSSQRASRYGLETEIPELHAATHTIEEELHRREQIQSALAKLPLLYRLPLILFTWSGYSTQEIAAALDCPNNTVKSRLYRARRLFIQAYQD